MIVDEDFALHMSHDARRRERTVPPHLARHLPMFKRGVCQRHHSHEDPDMINKLAVNQLLLVRHSVANDIAYGRIPHDEDYEFVRDVASESKPNWSAGGDKLPAFIGSLEHELDLFSPTISVDRARQARLRWMYESIRHIERGHDLEDAWARIQRFSPAEPVTTQEWFLLLQGATASRHTDGQHFGPVPVYERRMSLTEVKARLLLSLPSTEPFTEWHVEQVKNYEHPVTDAICRQSTLLVSRPVLTAASRDIKRPDVSKADKGAVTREYREPC